MLLAYNLLIAYKQIEVTMNKEDKIKAEDNNREEQPDTQKVAAGETETESTEKANDAEAAPSAEAEPEKQDPLAEAQKEIEELKDKYLRAVAEFDNYKKRTLKEKAELILNGGQKTVTAILPVLDDFERALADKSEDPKAIHEGMQMIFNKFEKTLEGLGVKKIDTEDKDFDVDFHEAVAMVPGMGDDKKGKVIDCMQSGYTMNDKVIRHAKVAVGQ
jgi:molecular chaperone GrpE